MVSIHGTANGVYSRVNNRFQSLKVSIIPQARFHVVTKSEIVRRTERTSIQRRYDAEHNKLYGAIISRLTRLAESKKTRSRFYKVTEAFPKSEIYGITSQLRRAAISVVSNIAEGQGRLTKGESHQFLGLSRGSLLELDTQLLIAGELGYLNEPSREALDSEIYQVLGLLERLMQSMQTRVL